MFEALLACLVADDRTPKCGLSVFTTWWLGSKGKCPTHGGEEGGGERVSQTDAILLLMTWLEAYAIFY